jgi:hypothetical protein
MDTVEKALMSTSELIAGLAANPIPPALALYLARQQRRAMELADLLGMLSQRNETGASASIAYRMACDLNEALDSVNLARNGGAS